MQGLRAKHQINIGRALDDGEQVGFRMPLSQPVRDVALFGQVGQEDLDIGAQAKNFFCERQPIRTGSQKAMEAHEGGPTF